MRDDEHGWEPKGPAQLIGPRRGRRAGTIIAWDSGIEDFPLTAASAEDCFCSLQSNRRQKPLPAETPTAAAAADYAFKISAQRRWSLEYKPTKPATNRLFTRSG
jgi:hypothetical protein